ncbi:MAG TPA: DMT family transporter [Acidimicrobiales bacterium]|jgi:drug/metabolite transporter (DMT)-like permease|nr:DMT family transporter [Acidimicrobiales bacterium]
MTAILFAALGSLCNASSAVVQRLANVSAPAEVSAGWRKALYLIRQPMWLIGLLFLVGTFAFTATALYFGEIAVVQPVLVIELIFMLGLRRFWLHDQIAMRTWGAAAITCIGLAGFLIAAHPQEGIGLPSASGWIKAVSGRVLIVLVLLALSRRGSPSRKAAMLGSSGAIIWSIDAGFMKAATAILSKDGWIHLLYHWPLYALVVTGILGTVLVQASLSVGPLMVSQAALLIVDPFSSIALGIELFDEHVNTSPAAITGAVLSLLLMGLGVVLMSRWAPPVMEAHQKLPADPEPGKVLLDGF